VKINGMTRATPSLSTVQLLITGVAFTVITNGIAQDDVGNQWALPPSVEIPTGGQTTVTGTCTKAGAVSALVNTITKIATVTLGWQTVTNPAAAIAGAPLESDSSLRQRQVTSTATPSVTVLSGIVGAVLSLPGVTACKPYENDTSTDYTGITPPIGEGPLPPHSISLVVEGGDPVQICQTILDHKTPGCYTYGTTRETVDDGYGLPHDIGFFIPTVVHVGVNISLKAGAGYSSLIGAQISNSVAAYINGLGSGEAVVWSKLWLPANLCDWTTGVPTNATNTYDITALSSATPPNSMVNVWANSTAYAINAYGYNSGNLYICTTAGTSAATGTGPAGTGTGIADGTCVWNYVSVFAGYGTTNIPIDIFQVAQCNASDVVVTAS
jgi:uncharacterized phage protein gp47/JayE